MPERSAKPIALLTDFGLADHFVGVMKGIIAGISPNSPVIDISHDVQPYAIAQARFLLEQSRPWLPPGSVFVCVVDPGVGTTRRAIAIKASKQLFVGPDNTLFTEVLALPGAEVREITNSKLFAGPPSSTFHGRDIFSPVGAHLAAGLAFSKIGPRIDDALRSNSAQVIRTGRRYWQGEVLHIDRFGNLITNLPAADFPDLSRRFFALRVGLTAITQLAATYADIPEDAPAAIAASHGYLEIACRQSSAARLLGVAVGSPVELELP